jgi:hypothetical protein
MPPQPLSHGKILEEERRSFWEPKEPKNFAPGGVFARGNQTQLGSFYQNRPNIVHIR